MRIEKILKNRRGDFDIIHDNQCMGPGILRLHREGWPVLETLHHPITVDRQLALSHTTNPWQQFSQRRWFGFLRMQVKVARALPRIITVSQSSKTDITAQMGVESDRMTIVPVGVKAEFIDRLGDAGLSVIEATSFVHPKWVPQLADAGNRIDRLGEAVRKLPGEEQSQVSGRVAKLQSWGKKSRTLAPMILRLLGG